MEINGPPLAPLNLTSALQQLQSLRIGQLVQAVVIKQLANDAVLLQMLTPTSSKAPPLLPGQPPQPLQLLAETPQPLTLGQRLLLQVSQLGEKPILKVLSETETTPALLKQTATNTPLSEPQLKAALMQALPRQTSMTPLLANLSWINQQQSTAIALPQAIQAMAKELFDKLPTKEKISTAEGIKQAIKDSGLFLENKLSEAAQTKSTPESGDDLKNLLLRLFSSVQKQPAGGATQTPSQTAARPTQGATPLIPVPPPTMSGNRPQPQHQAEATLATLNNALNLIQELGKQTEGSIARTQLHQLASLPTPDQNPAVWSFELPIRNQEQVDLFHFVIEEYKGGKDGNDEPKHRWSVTIAFDLEALGPMYTRLQLENGKISTTFWADSFDTSTLITQNLPELAQRFKAAGLESSELRAFRGQPPEAVNRDIPRIVLDVKV